MSYEAPAIGSPPSTRELLTLAAVYETGSTQAAAIALGIGDQTVRNRLRALYARLDVHSAIQAGTRLGWITVPGTCGWLGACGRNEGHRGHHGGFREVMA
jgi:hypothetical protein